MIEDYTAPLEAEMLLDASDGRLDRHTLLSAALIASGVGDRQTLHQYEAAFHSVLRRLRRQIADSHSLRENARAIFEFMHAELLVGGYYVQTSDLRETLGHGKYNCLTATIVYHCLANQIGLPTCAVQSPGHVLSRVFLPDGFLDVETTCPRWFRLADRPSEQAEYLSRTPATAQSIRTGPLREASEVELVAMVYYNRGVDLLAEARYAEAAAANLKALRLAPGSCVAKGNLLATINNWAIELARRQQFPEAANLLRLGMSIDPSFQTFMVNYVHLHHQWAFHLYQEGKAEQAIGMLLQQAEAFPQEPFFARAAAELHRRQQLPAKHTQIGAAEVLNAPAPAALVVPTSAPDPTARRP